MFKMTVGILIALAGTFAASYVLYQPDRWYQFAVVLWGTLFGIGGAMLFMAGLDEVTY